MRRQERIGVHMPLERIDSYFNGAVESYDERLKRSAEDEDGYIRRTAEFFPKKEHLHILDIGIGTGTGLTAIEERTVLTDGKCIFPAQTDGFSVVNIFSLKEENV